MSDTISHIAGLGLKEQMALAWANQRHISNNIANVHTPGFQATRSELIQKDMEALIELNRSNPNHLTLTESESALQFKTVPVADFSLDSEMGDMAKNSLFYQTLQETVLRRSQMARSVLGGR